MQADRDPDFYVSYIVDTENMLENLFWANSISRVDYECFSDVLTFDTTYKKNGYDLPLMVFIGVNHYHQTIVFVFALDVKENVETFKWALICVRHIQRNAIANLGDLDAIAAFKRCMMCWWNKEEFESAWKELVDSYELEDNKWIKEKYKTKHM
ncbi:hypothetical protein REPUB_Repub11eG0050900 [Reevesia pubescens]